MIVVYTVCSRLKKCYITECMEKKKKKKSPKCVMFSILYPFQIASRPGARHFRCLFRVVYVPRDSYDLLKQDPVAFEYFYMQVNTSSEYEHTDLQHLNNVFRQLH